MIAKSVNSLKKLRRGLIMIKFDWQMYMPKKTDFFDCISINSTNTNTLEIPLKHEYYDDVRKRNQVRENKLENYKTGVSSGAFQYP